VSPVHSIRSVLVTGATGFIGSNLALRLVEEGYRVRILRRAHSDLRALRGVDVEHRLGDIRDREAVENAVRGCDTVFHSAAIVSFKRSRYAEQLEVNVDGTRNIVAACLKEGVEQLVHTSSVAAIGYRHDDGLIDEETPFNWEGTAGYRVSKHRAEQEILDGVRRGLSAVMVNPSVVIGERDIHFHGGQILRDVRRGIVPLYIDGGMNVVYVGDVVAGHLAAAQRGRSGERYILAGENLTHREVFSRTAAIVGGRPPFARLPLPLLRLGAALLEKVTDALGKDPLITRDLVAGAGRFHWFTCGKAERELGYTSTPFDMAVRLTFAWYRSEGLL
jgi:dihydroflavonol-4-reductase